MIGYHRQRVDRDGVELVFHSDEASGHPVVLQHGLCGDAGQPAELFPRQRGFRHHVLDCRGHGESEAGDPAGFGLAVFTDDLAAALDAGGIPACAVGGISMGAALALRLAATDPARVTALVLVRPAWLTGPAPPNLQPNAEVGRSIQRGETAAAFAAGPTGRRLAREAPDNLASLLGFFRRTPLPTTAALLTQLSADGPGLTDADLARLRVPTLVIGSAEDAIHPFAVAAALAGAIPGARLVEVTPKGRDRQAHVAEVQTAIGGFLEETT